VLEYILHCVYFFTSGSELGTPTNVFVQNCPDAGKCVLHKGVNMSFGVDFTSSM